MSAAPSSRSPPVGERPGDRPESRPAERSAERPAAKAVPRGSSAVHIWVMAARVRTLPAAIAPVLVGTSLALGNGHFNPFAFVAALLGAIFIQVGTNLSNDYSDARRGADTEDRLGPVRVTAGGLVPPRQVLLATYATFGLAVLCGVYLVAVAGWGLIAVGAASILAGVLYTGGPRPYGYEGLGELFVFLFFGIVAVAGSYYVQVQHLPWQAFACAVPVGLLASAILVVNNVRDIDTDRRAGKRTLAVRLGRRRTRTLYTAMLAVAFACAPLPWLLGSMSAWLLAPWAAIPLAVSLAQVVRTRVDGPSLNGALARTGLLQLLFCLLFSAGILASGGIGG
jgi:1,4-dihydroxy-2-naphthoate octaprenyltransferase